MAGDCIFCQILHGESPASFTYQDDTVVAFMDVQPITQGHMLVVPREHAVLMTDINETAAMRTFRVARKLAAYAGAPLAVVRRLARDVIEVAEPILTHARVLPDSELAAIIKDFGLGHAAAIARRHAGAEPQAEAPALPQRVPALETRPAVLDAPVDLELAELFLSADSARPPTA